MRNSLFQLTQLLQLSTESKGERLREWTGSIGSVCLRPSSRLSVYPGFQLCVDGYHPCGGDFIGVWIGSCRWRKCTTAGPLLPPVEEHPWRPVTAFMEHRGSTMEPESSLLLWSWWLQRPKPPTSSPSSPFRQAALEAARLLNSGSAL